MHEGEILEPETYLWCDNWTRFNHLYSKTAQYYKVPAWITLRYRFSQICHVFQSSKTIKMHKKLNLRRIMAFRTMNVSLWTIWWLKVSNKNHPIIFRKPLTKCLGGLWEPDLWIWTDKTMKSFFILLDKMSTCFIWHGYQIDTTRPFSDRLSRQEA